MKTFLIKNFINEMKNKKLIITDLKVADRLIMSVFYALAHFLGIVQSIDKPSVMVILYEENLFVAVMVIRDETVPYIKYSYEFLFDREKIPKCANNFYLDNDNIIHLISMHFKQQDINIIKYDVIREIVEIFAKSIYQYFYIEKGIKKIGYYDTNIISEYQEMKEKLQKIKDGLGIV